jgi:hypothetical protein
LQEQLGIAGLLTAYFHYHSVRIGRSIRSQHISKYGYQYGQNDYGDTNQSAFVSLKSPPGCSCGGSAHYLSNRFLFFKDV